MHNGKGNAMALQKYSILFVDDEQVMGEIGKKMMEELGYKITVFTDPIEVLKTFRRNPHELDLVITDYCMPNMNGDQLAMQLHTIRDNIPIILATGNNNISEKDLQNWGINELIIKPYQSEEIAPLIQRALNDSL